MTIEIKSLGEFFGFIIAGVSVMSLGAWAHWKIFASPIINKILAPMVDSLAVSSRLLKKKYPTDYEVMESDVRAERVLRGNA